ncbi:MAG: hypothetical protein VX498_06935 [Myxococcota bacterium]|nr:hypothetical protein [Myxococcota bacterium]
MSSCPSCSAPARPDALVCEHCATALRSLASPQEEIDALEALAAAAQRISSESPGGLGTAYFSQLGLARAANQKVADFWKNAFIPSTLPGLERATLLAIGQIQTDAWKSVWHQGTKAANTAALARLDALGAALRIQAVGAGEGRARALATLEEASRAKEKLTRAKRMGILMYVGLLALLLGFFACAGFFALVVGAFA